MDLETIFKRLGLKRNAHKIYKTLLKARKPLSISNIASGSRITRAEVYRNISDLEKYNFISQKKSGKRFFYLAESPQRINKKFIEAAEITSLTGDRIARRIEGYLPYHMEYYEGFQGIRSVFDDVVDRTSKGDTFYRYTSEKDLDRVNKYLSPKYRQKRDAKKIERLVISNPISGRQKRPRLERFIKFMNADVAPFEQNVIQLIYADSLAFINLDTEKAFIVRDRKLAEFQTVIFKQLYRRLE